MITMNYYKFYMNDHYTILQNPLYYDKIIKQKLWLVKTSIKCTLMITTKYYIFFIDYYKILQNTLMINFLKNL